MQERFVRAARGRQDKFESRGNFCLLLLRESFKASLPVCSGGQGLPPAHQLARSTCSPPLGRCARGGKNGREGAVSRQRPSLPSGLPLAGFARCEGLSGAEWLAFRAPGPTGSAATEPPRWPFSPGSAHRDLPSSRLTCPSPLARWCSGPPGPPRSQSARNGSPAAPGPAAAAAAPHSRAPRLPFPAGGPAASPSGPGRPDCCTWSARRPLSGPAPARNEACFALAGLIESGPLARLQAARRSRAAVDPEGRAGAGLAAQRPPGDPTYRGCRQCQGSACVCVWGGAPALRLEP